MEVEISKNSDFIRNIARAQEKVTEAEEELADVKQSLDYFNELAKEFNKQD